MAEAAPAEDPPPEAPAQAARLPSLYSRQGFDEGMFTDVIRHFDTVTLSRDVLSPDSEMDLIEPSLLVIVEWLENRSPPPVHCEGYAPREDRRGDISQEEGQAIAAAYNNTRHYIFMTAYDGVLHWDAVVRPLEHMRNIKTISIVAPNATLATGDNAPPYIRTAGLRVQVRDFSNWNLPTSVRLKHLTLVGANRPTDQLILRRCGRSLVELCVQGSDVPSSSELIERVRYNREAQDLPPLDISLFDKDTTVIQEHPSFDDFYIDDGCVSSNITIISTDETKTGTMTMEVSRTLDHHSPEFFARRTLMPHVQKVHVHMPHLTNADPANPLLCDPFEMLAWMPFVRVFVMDAPDVTLTYGESYPYLAESLHVININARAILPSEEAHDFLSQNGYLEEVKIVTRLPWAAEETWHYLPTHRNLQTCIFQPPQPALFARIAPVLRANHAFAVAHAIAAANRLRGHSQLPTLPTEMWWNIFEFM